MSSQPPLGFHSLREEVTGELPVEGRIPDWLSGSLVRNGPGAFELGDGTVDHWFDGLAMLHQFTFDDGVTYRNRFLRTDAYQAARDGAFDGGFATGETTLRERLKAFVLDDPYDNANVITERVGDRYLALTETPRWVEFDPVTLETRGHVQYDGTEPAGRLACAHMNRDPATGEMVNFETAFGRTSEYHVYSMASPTERDHVGSVAVEEPAYMHSFALTPNYVVLTEFPFVVDPMAFLRPGKQGPFVDNFEWRPDRGTRFLVLDRETGELVAQPRTEAFFGFHHANAFEDGDDLVLDLETVPDAGSIDHLYLDELRVGDLDAFGGRLERFRVHLGAADAAVDRRTIHDGGTALPTVSPARWCREHRYVYSQGTDQPVTEWPQSVKKIDTVSGTARTFSAAGDHFSEPIFVPRPDGTAEDDGVVLTVALDDDAARSVLVVLDGDSFSELARAPLPHPIPFDFHGRFFAELT